MVRDPGELAHVSGHGATTSSLTAVRLNLLVLRPLSGNYSASAVEGVDTEVSVCF